MNVKIESCARELRTLRDDPTGTEYTGIKVNGEWYNLEGDHRSLWKKVVDLEFNGKFAKFAKPQQPPAAAQPAPLPPLPSQHTNGHTPKWASRNDAVNAYIFYATQVEQWIKEPYAIVKAANCLVMMEAQGEINPVNKPQAQDDDR